jgi:hypothetical protein
MQLVGPMVLLVRAAPHGQALAWPAEMHGLFGRALLRHAPMTIANPAKVAAEVADHHLNIRAFILIAHSVHLCTSVSTAQHYAVGSSGRIEVELGATMVAHHNPSTPLLLLYCASAKNQVLLWIELTTFAPVLCTFHTKEESICCTARRA